MKFPVLQINSAQGPFFYKEEHSSSRLPSTGHAIPSGAQRLFIKDQKGNQVGQVIIPVGFSIGE